MHKTQTHMIKITVAAIAAVIIFGARQLIADVIVLNRSFEANTSLNPQSSYTVGDDLPAVINWDFPAYPTQIAGLVTDGPVGNFGGLQALSPFPQGSKAAFLYGNSTFSQSISGLEVGKKYVVSFWSSGRPAPYGPQEVQVRLDGAILTFGTGTNVTPSSSAWALYTSDAVVASSSTCTLSFTGVSSAEMSSFIDMVSVSEAPGRVTFTENVTIASGAEVGSWSGVKINPVGGDVDIAYSSASGLAYRTYIAGKGVTAVDVVDSTGNCYWIGGIGRGEGKIKIGYCDSYVLTEVSRDESDTTWASIDTGFYGTAVPASGAYAVDPVTGLGGFVSRALDESVFYVEDQGLDWGDFTDVLDSGSGSTYPNLLYDEGGTPHVGVNYGKINGTGPAPWAGPLQDTKRVHNLGIYNYYHNALGENGGMLYFVNARSNIETKLYYTDAEGNWLSDGLITNGYYGDGLAYAMDVSPSGKIAVVLFDQREGDSGPTLYLATKEGLGERYSWYFTRLAAAGNGGYPDVKFDDAGNLYVAYYDAETDALYLKTTVRIVAPEEYGAVGNGSHDDTDAFYAAAQEIYNKGSGTLILTSGKIYRVGRQFHVAGQYPYYQTAPAFWLEGSPARSGLWVAVEGNGATIKVNNLRIGSFDRDNGTVYNPVLPFTDRDYRVDAGNVFFMSKCSSVRIRNVLIDGNASNLILGGYWGDSGRQCGGNGIALVQNEYIRVDNIISSHCGLDGIYLDYPEATVESPEQNWAVSNSRFEYNARQGMSWAGGKGLTVLNCKFNHTGRDTFFSDPGAGLDIEADWVNRNGLFVSCEFVNNIGCGMVADGRDSADITFIDCLFWGTTNYSAWPDIPRVLFENCTFHGTMVRAHGSSDPSLATQFFDCHFEDVDAQYEGVSYSSLRSYLIELSGNNVLFEGCTMVANQTRSLYLNAPGTPMMKVYNCEITHNWKAHADHEFLCLMRYVNIKNTIFHESLITSKRFYISIGNLAVGSGVYVDGPRCKWENWNWGIIGTIPETP